MSDGTKSTPLDPFDRAAEIEKAQDEIGEAFDKILEGYGGTYKQLVHLSNGRTLDDAIYMILTQER